MSNLSGSVSRKFARLVATLVCLLWMASGSVAWAEIVGVRASDSSNNSIVVTSSDYAVNNITTNYNSSSDSLSVYGGSAHQSGLSASNNNVTVTGGSVDGIYGGFASEKSEGTFNNNVTIKGGSIGGITGGYSSGNALANTTGNVVNIEGGEITNAIGAHVMKTNGFGDSINVSDNNVNITGGKVNGWVMAVEQSVTSDLNSITIKNNAINIYGNPDLSSANLVGIYNRELLENNFFGRINVNSLSLSNNNLNIYTKGLTAQNIGNFDNINFYLPESTVNGDTVLTLTGGYATDISGATVKAGVQGNANLNNGDTVTLIKNNSGITDTGTTYGTLTEGVSLNYDLTVEKADANTVVARIGSVSSDPNGYSTPVSTATAAATTAAAVATPAISSNNGTRLLAQTSVLPAPSIAAPAMVSHHIESTINWLPPIDDFGGKLDVISTEGSGDSGEPVTGGDDSAESLEAGRHAGVSGYNIFANMGYSSMRTKTGKGSYMDTKSGGFDIGASRAFENGNSVIHFAPIFDYGTGNYDSYMGNGIHGSGNAKFYMGGFIARQTFDSGFYYEGSFRYGRATLDFFSDDVRYQDKPVSYEASAPCWAAHAKMGLRYKVDDNNILDLYGIYFHTHQGAMETDLSSGESYRFDAVTNYRLRAGARLTRRINDHSRFYSGLAYEYTHDGAARGTYLARGLTTEEVGASGSSVMVELGWQYKPTKDNPWMVDVNATGSFGHNRGFALQAKMKKEF